MSQLAEPPAPSRRVLGIVLRLALSGALLWYLLSRLDRGELLSAMNDVHVGGWLLAVLVYLVSQIVSAVRWATLARPIGFRLGWLRFQQLYFEGMFFSLCLPSAIGGDVVKALRLGSGGRGRILAACTVLADRLAGMAAVLLIGLTGLAQLSYGLSAAQTAGVGLTLAAITLAGTRLVFAVLNWPSGRIPEHHPIAHLVDRLLPYYHHPYVFWSGIGWSMIVQGLNVLTVMLLGGALGLDLPAQAYCIAVPFVALATALPISFNGIGVRELLMAEILSFYYGVPDALGAALGFLWLSVTIATGLIGGLVYLLGPPLGEHSEMSSDDTRDEEDPNATTFVASKEAV
jgi:glycosyltransferase 2 family protein